MAASAKSGPEFIFGNLSAIPAALTGSPVPDPNQDASPSGLYQWAGVLDARYLYTKDQVTGYTGVVAEHFAMPLLRSTSMTPAAVSASNIAAAQHTTNGTALTFAAASLGIATNIPYRPFTGVVPGAAPVTAAIALDFGFDFCTTTAASTTVTVGSPTSYVVGMPLVIAQVGNSGGTAPLLTNVVSVNLANSTIVVANAAIAAKTGTPVGTGDLWGPNEIPQGFPVPTAAAPWIAAGPGLILDGRQAASRGVQIAGATSGAGGTFLVTGVTIYGETVTDLITVGAGAVTGWSTKTFKYIISVVPTFTDAHNYSVGTSDVFGFATRVNVWDDSLVTYASALMTSATGFTAADATSPATNATGDTRGTIQVSANGGGSGIGANATNGSLSGLVMTGRRLHMSHAVSALTMVSTTQANPTPLFGVTPA